MILESLRLRNFRCFGDQAEVVTLEPGLTAFVGANGAGKTTIIAALQKLFGTRVEDRRLVREDVHFGPDEEPGIESAGGEDDVFQDAVHNAPIANAADVDRAGRIEAATPAHQVAAPQPTRISRREIEIEVVISLPELASDVGSNDAIPDVFRAMCVDGVGGTPRLRIRLEATWAYGVDEDDLSSRLYWISTLDPVAFGERDIAKVSLPPTDRRRIQIRYLPATRDSNAIIRQALRELLSWLERFGDWSGGREPMERQWGELQALFDNMPAIEVVTENLGRVWTRLFDGPHLQAPRLTVLAREVQRALRELSLTLGPGPAGRHRSVHDLSEGQSSLFYIALVTTLIKLDEQLANGIPAGFLDRSTLRPWLTIIALEEPENHLAPFYLSRMVALMDELSSASNVMGVLTTHSASALRRLKPQQIRHVRHEHLTLLSRARSIPLPPADQAEAQKFVQEAVSSHPELYFSRLVILGEGRSEQIVLPHMARALDPQLELDPAFVAFVPLGGRHVNHFWRLLNGLKIPHLTLLDYDLGRAKAGPLRLKYAVDQLRLIEITPPDHLIPPKTAALWRELTPDQVEAWRAWLASQGVFYSVDLDLDMMMLRAFPEAYAAASEISAPEADADYCKSVFGEKGVGPAAYSEAARPSLLELARYEELFKKGSKPVAHVDALKELSDNDIRASCPTPLRALFEACRSMLGLPAPEPQVAPVPMPDVNFGAITS